MMVDVYCIDMLLCVSHAVQMVMNSAVVNTLARITGGHTFESDAEVSRLEKLMKIHP